jgi:hypothetical protein
MGMSMPEVTQAGELAPAPAVEEKPAPVAEEQKTETAADVTADPEQETTEQQEAKKQSKFQRRLDRQKTARIQAETRAEIAERRVAELEAQSKPQPKEGEPKREDFPDDYEAYLRAVARYDAKQETAATLKAEREARQGKEKQGTEAARNEKLAKDWTEREKTFQAATKDYEETVTPFVDDELQSFSQQARMAIVESEVGPNLLFHLATHLEEAERIAGLSPVRQIAELGKLEDKISAPPKKTTSAPAPISPVNGGKTASKDISKMSQEEYEQHRKSQGARWAR